MRYLLALLFTFLTPQSPDVFPPLGIIDFYGLRTVPEAQLLQALPYHLDNSSQSINSNHKSTPWNGNSLRSPV
jgi:hypothetical protein